MCDKGKKRKKSYNSHVEREEKDINSETGIFIQAHTLVIAFTI